MLAKGKGKDNDNESITANRVIPAIIVSYAIKQAK
jgi:hypothetical protein